jgi:hypothetical protein
MSAESLRDLFPMESVTSYANRNTLVDEWEVPLLRLHSKQKLLFDDNGSFDVRIVRIGKLVRSINRSDFPDTIRLSSSASQTSKLLWSNSELQLADNLHKTSNDAYRIMYD